ncbi:MAG: hypothetical protein EA367_09640 [Leptolyngbya sp. DLM2.Bin15]|nr:MAG: hypothetical protein EA367_09640 [Leptolyngbya sp. DLM2.Bin15]
MAKKRLSDLLRDEAQKPPVDTTDAASADPKADDSAKAETDAPEAEKTETPAASSGDDASATGERSKPMSRMTKVELEQAWKDSQAALEAAQASLAERDTQIAALERQVNQGTAQIAKLKADLEESRQVILTLSEVNQQLKDQQIKDQQKQSIPQDSTSGQQNAKPPSDRSIAARRLELGPPQNAPIGRPLQRPIQPNGLPPMPSENMPSAPLATSPSDRRSSLPPMPSDRLSPPPTALPRPMLGYGTAPQAQATPSEVKASALPRMSTEALNVRRLPPMLVEEAITKPGDRLSESDIGWVD